jgi:hypothetical protein
MTTLNRSIKNWYQSDYGFGAGAGYIRKNLQFKTVLGKMIKGENFYQIVFTNGFADSIVRERIFEKLAELLGVTYKEIYNIWLTNKKFPPSNQFPAVLKPSPQ